MPPHGQRPPRPPPPGPVLPNRLHIAGWRRVFGALAHVPEGRSGFALHAQICFVCDFSCCA
eukprot:6217520-Lingulodinium_polyedra.AAC.1